jgi:hypothetical protein
VQSWRHSSGVCCIARRNAVRTYASAADAGGARPGSLGWRAFVLSAQLALGYLPYVGDRTDSSET